MLQALSSTGMVSSYRDAPQEQKMNEQATQTEIKAIQERLQAMRAGHHSPRPAAAPMVEMFPQRFSASNLTGNGGNTPVEETAVRAEYRPDVERRSLSAASGERRSPAAAASSRPAHKSTAADADLSRQQEALQRLEAKAQQINQLSAAQETAMLELKAIATRLERDWTALELQYGDAYARDASLPAALPHLCDYVATDVPAIERNESGAFVVTTRAVDLFKAERDAEVMAHTLRRRNGTSATRQRRTAEPSGSMWAGRRAGGRASKWADGQVSSLLQSLWVQVQAIANSVTAQSSARANRRTRMAQVQPSAASYADDYSQGYAQDYAQGYSQDYAQDYAQDHASGYPSHSRSQPSQTNDTLSYQASALWLGGAIVARIAANLFLAAHPGFWIPVVGLMVAPTAIAIYRATVAPQSSMIWGYRLFLVMIGLLLGGRLG